jgi:hypothetical protein
MADLAGEQELLELRFAPENAARGGSPWYAEPVSLRRTWADRTALVVLLRNFA